MLSSINRFSEFSALEAQKFDLVIIGGGITGAGIALDATLRGLSVALFEKQDFAQGTSSRSTKLVHGGLRYLEHLEFGVVRDVGRERKIVHENAMHVVLPEKMILPITRKGKLNKFSTNIALKMYDYLAEVKKSERRRMLSRDEVLEKEPLLDSPEIKSGAIYSEYKTNDSRLTIEVLKKANEHGAKVFNYAEVTEFLYSEDKKVKGVRVKDLIGGGEIQVFADYVVNATGIWVDELCKLDNHEANRQLHITKGIHIVVDKEKLPLSHSLYFDTDDGRMVFIIPRTNVVYIGTTDTKYDQDYMRPTIETKDVEYLLRAVNNLSPKINLCIDDVASAWSGLRPLIHQEGRSPSELSRRDEIFYAPSGLISIAGGKLTGYRLMAKKIVDIIRKRMLSDGKKDIGECTTKNIKLSGGEFDFEYSLIKLVEYADNKYDEAKQISISVEDFKKLFYRYGTNIDFLINKAFEYYGGEKNTKLVWLKSEVWYVVNYEGVLSVSDFFVRRTEMLHFDIMRTLDLLHDTANYMQEFLGWTDEEKKRQEDSFRRDYESATVFL